MQTTNEIKATAAAMIADPDCDYNVRKALRSLLDGTNTLESLVSDPDCDANVRRVLRGL